MLHWCDKNVLFIVDASSVCKLSSSEDRQKTKSKYKHTLSVSMNDFSKSENFLVNITYNIFLDKRS